jgi:L-alanine-DL-glutamate epimerase-like enolase superfamily enzyme
LLAIETDGGITGHSFYGGASRGADAEGRSFMDALKPLLLGQNPLDRERLYQRMWARGRLTMVRAIGAFDVALWDLAGKAAGLPIHQLLGRSAGRPTRSIRPIPGGGTSRSARQSARRSAMTIR